MSGLVISNRWMPLDARTAAGVSAQLGVFEIGDDAGTVLLIGYGGGREPFGLRSALSDISRDPPPGGSRFRCEFTHAYLTRFEELLMVHAAAHGRLPLGNAGHPYPVGRLAVG